MGARSYSFTSESVTEGHPDKVADQISDSVLDAVLADDPEGRVACETLITTGLVVVAGEITTKTYVDIPRLVRERISSIGYTRAKYGIDEHGHRRPVEIERVLVSTQHREGLDPDVMIKPDIVEHVLEPILPKSLYDTRRLEDKDFVFVNPTGKFVIGGPMGDTGLTGRKIIVDTYGGAAPHGGGAFSGKDPTKVDRSAAYAARYVAKNVVAAGLASRCPIQVAYAIGVAHPFSILVDTFDTEAPGMSPAKIEALVREHFDLRPAAILRDLDLRRPIYAKTAAYGHFGRDDHDFSWERVDKADTLREAAGLGVPATA